MIAVFLRTTEFTVETLFVSFKTVDFRYFLNL
jgi:hypothetical protein